MKKIHYLGLIVMVMLGVTACEQGASEKMAEYDALRAERKALDAKIQTLREELIAAGEIKISDNSKVLVAARPIQSSSFYHKVELRGAVSSKKNVILTTQTAGKIERINVKEGQSVRKGQLLVKLDDEITRNSIAEVETQLELAADVYERQARLWDKKVGTEIQYIQAKNNKESLEKRLATLKSQLDLYYVRSPFDGVIDDIPVREGEIAQPGVMPVVRLVNEAETYINADVSEYHLGKFSEGQEVEIFFPTQDVRVTSTIRSVGQVIKMENRTFEIEVYLPKVDFPVQPNQVVVLDVIDYESDDALIVPSELVQKDNDGNFVFGIEDEGGDKRAKKIHVEVGLSFEQKTEIISGLKRGQVIAYEGYRDLSQNSLVKIAQ